MKKAVQQLMLGTVMNNQKQAQNTLSAIKNAGYDGIELCGFMIHPMGMMVRLLTQAAGMPVGKGGSLNWHWLIEKSGLEVIGLHLDLGTLEKDISGCAKEAKSFGTKYIVITGMYRFDYSSEAAVKALAGRLNNAGKELKKFGVDLLYHNHNCELLRTESGKRAYEILLEGTDPDYVNFEFDSYWFADGGADVLYWMRRLGSRMKLWHINDRGSRVSGTTMTPILKSNSMELGTGNMPLDVLMEQAKNASCEAVILESHRNWIEKSPIHSLQQSSKYLNKRV
jgi:sugar phosphate isomerase/epimerase